MSELETRLGNRYEQIIAHFREHPYDENSDDVAEFSRLPNPDRAIVLETLLRERCGNIEHIVWALAHQYFRVGHEHYTNFDKWATLFINKCRDRWVISQSFHTRLASKLRSMAVNGYQPAFVRDYKSALTYMTKDKCEMTKLVRSLFETYQDKDEFRIYLGVDYKDGIIPILVKNPNYKQNMADFDTDRIKFINSI